MSPGNRKYTSYYFFHINDHYSLLFFSVMKWFLWSSIPPSISKHPASRPWKTTYPGPERMISSRIPLLISFVSSIPPRSLVPSRIPPNLCWTLYIPLFIENNIRSAPGKHPLIRAKLRQIITVTLLVTRLVAVSSKQIKQYSLLKTVQWRSLTRKANNRI